MKLQLVKGSANVTLQIFIQDSSATTGAGNTGLLATNLSAYYSRVEDDNDVLAVEITLSDLTGTGTVHTDGGLEEIDATNMPGWYRFDIPDAVCATGASVAGISIIDSGANDVAQVTIEIQLTDVDFSDAVRGGMTALPNAAAEATGGLYTRGTGAGQINQDADGRIDTNTVAWIATAVTLGAGAPDVNVATMDANSIATGTIASGELTNIEDEIWDALKSAHVVANSFGDFLDIEVSGRLASADINLTGGAVDTVTTVGTTTTNTDMRGTDSAALASVLGALDDAAVDGDPTASDTAMQYVKQLVNVLVGTTGVTAWAAGAAPANGVSISEALRAIFDDTNSLDGTKVPDTISLANINGEVVDVLTVDTVTLPGQEAPPLTPTIEEAIAWLYKVFRNRTTQTSTEWQLLADNETTVDAKAVVSDDGSTAIIQEIASGP